MRLYHRTNAAEPILSHGFRDGTGSDLTLGQHTGVWVSDVPLDGQEGAVGEALLAVEVDEVLITQYEWIEEEKPYREWLVPAALLNQQAETTLLDADEVEAAEAEAAGRRFGSDALTITPSAGCSWPGGRRALPAERPTAGSGAGTTAVAAPRRRPCPPGRPPLAKRRGSC